MLQDKSSITSSRQYIIPNSTSLCAWTGYPQCQTHELEAWFVWMHYQQRATFIPWCNGPFWFSILMSPCFVLYWICFCNSTLISSCLVSAGPLLHSSAYHKQLMHFVEHCYLFQGNLMHLSRYSSMTLSFFSYIVASLQKSHSYQRPDSECHRRRELPCLSSLW